MPFPATHLALVIVSHETISRCQCLRWRCRIRHVRSADSASTKARDLVSCRAAKVWLCSLVAGRKGRQPFESYLRAWEFFPPGIRAKAWEYPAIVSGIARL